MLAMLANSKRRGEDLDLLPSLIETQRLHFGFCRGEASNTNGDAKGLPKGFGKVGFQRMANGFYGVSEKERTPLADLVAVLLAESGDVRPFLFLLPFMH